VRAAIQSVSAPLNRSVGFFAPGCVARAPRPGERGLYGRRDGTLGDGAPCVARGRRACVRHFLLPVEVSS